jgi:flagellar biosynthesis protein FlhF
LVVRRFFAANTRECLRLVREALGKDALILANRQVAGGVEIMAVSEREVAVVTSSANGLPDARPDGYPNVRQDVRQDVRPDVLSNDRPTMPAGSAQAPALRDGALTYEEAVASARIAAPAAGSAPIPEAAAPSPTSSHASPSSALPSSAPSLRSPPPLSEAPPPAGDGATRELADEIRQLRGVVEGQLSGFAWHQMAARAPIQVELLRELLTRGFGGTFSRDLASRLASDETLPRAIRWVKTHLVDSLQCVSAGDDIVSRGGVYALVGPTGVGKTTTVAKIAASCTLQHGPSQVALVTTDSYRIGAVDQLRIYGRILGVPVFVAKDEDDLGVTLAELEGRRLVLIDTVGMNQRDRRVAEQVAMLTGHGKPVSRLLLLSAVAQGEALEDVVRCYRGDGLAGCILTKVDESVSLGGAIDVILRAGLPLHYVTNGQRVPEDLHLASPLYLVDRAFRTEAERSGFQPSADDMPLLFAARSGRLAQAPGA